MELVAFLGTGKGTWGQVAGVINQGEWENIILIGNNFAKKFTSEKDFELEEFLNGLEKVGEEMGVGFLKV